MTPPPLHPGSALSCPALAWLPRPPTPNPSAPVPTPVMCSPRKSLHTCVCVCLRACACPCVPVRAPGSPDPERPTPTVPVPSAPAPHPPTPAMCPLIISLYAPVCVCVRTRRILAQQRRGMAGPAGRIRQAVGWAFLPGLPACSPVGPYLTSHGHDAHAPLLNTEPHQP
jgi:hypothetical protein